MKNTVVDILMATFNGERYIENQLLSLIQQTHKSWILLIADDGSTDKTVDIIRKYEKIDSRIKLININKNSPLGAGKTFLNLTRSSQSSYTIFCDQDDIWFEKKIETLLSFAEENFVEEKPSMVYCDAYGYSDSMGIITINGVSKLHAKELKDFLFFNAGYQGCSILFNRCLCDFVAEYKADFFYMHDDVVSLIAHSFGDVFFINKKLMLYRQHDKNVTGNIEVVNFKKIINFLFSKKPVISRIHSREKYCFYKAYGDKLSNENKRIFQLYLKFIAVGLLSRFMIIFSGGFTLGGHRIPLLLKTLIRKSII